MSFLLTLEFFFGFGIILVSMSMPETLAANLKERDHVREQIDGIIQRTVHESQNEIITFTLYSTPKTWQQATVTCENFGRDSYLAIVNNYLELELIINMTKEWGVPSVWLGASDSENEGDWEWTATEQEITKYLWGPNEPNGGDNENCMELSSTHGLNDLNCDVEQAYICQTIKIFPVNMNQTISR